MRSSLFGGVVLAAAQALLCGCGSSGGSGPADASTGDGGHTGLDGSGITDSATNDASTPMGDASSPMGDASSPGDATTGGMTVAPAGGHDGGCAASETAGAAGFPFPPVIAAGGAQLSPKIVSITFSTETDTPQLAALGDGLASGCYWDTIRAGYCDPGCVGDGPTGTTIQLSTPPAASYTDPSASLGTLPTFLQGLITAGTVPAPDANTVYAMYFPASTTIDQDGALSCQSFDGYHSAFQMGNANVYYAVINECPASAPLTTFQNTTMTTSHEAVETATDGDSQGYYLDLSQEPTWGWADVQSGGEVGDLCVDPFGLGLDEFTENGFAVQRIWSATNASAGKNPCIPIPQGEVYFNAYTKNSVLVMDVGASKTIEVDALADGTMPAWTVSPQDWTDPNTAYLSFSISGVTTGDAGPMIQMKSGDTMMLTVKLLADPTGSPNGEADGVVVSANASDPNSVTAAHFWPFVVVSTAEANDAGITMMKHTRQGGRPVRRHQRARNVFGGFR